MGLKIDQRLTPKSLLPDICKLFDASADKILSLQRSWNPARGTPVFTLRGKYTCRGWTEWTQGFQFGSALLQYDATGDRQFFDIGLGGTLRFMASHVSHTGVHDHGFNNVSTYGNLWRLMREGRLPDTGAHRAFCELALKVSGAVQAARWTALNDTQGYIYSFNGPHSLFVDTVRSLRSLAVAHQLGHVLMGERDRRISLLGRLLQHAESTARYNVFYGEGRDAYDVRGRTAHEAVFNTNDGSFRCPNSQQGFSPFTTWTRGLAWAILGFAEELEFLDTAPEAEVRQALFENDKQRGSSGRHKRDFQSLFLKAAAATADFYLRHSCLDGIPMWDTGAPNLHRLGNYENRPADPYNPWEPVDSSAAAIAAQGLIRLGNYLVSTDQSSGCRYRQAGLTVARTLFNEPYLSLGAKHQGLLVHSVYHRPNGWDYIDARQKVPNGESSMWGDYHARELALLVLREATGGSYPTFFQPRARARVGGEETR